MKKNKFLFIFLIITFFIACIYLYKARQLNTFPFNTKIGYYIPNSFKSIIYKILTPSHDQIISDKHILNVESITLPNYNFKMKYGGAIENLDEMNILYLSVDSDIYLFNTKNKKFKNLENNISGAYNVRDIKVIENQKLFAVLTVDKKNTNCGTIVLRLYDFDFNNNIFLYNNERKLWESEENCKFNSKTSGGRIEFKNDTFYISTGIFQSPINSGIIPENWSQKNNSSFGKIIKIPLNNKYEKKIYAKGFRNPQGLFYFNNILIGTDHGPKGGDEINIIKQDENYGWPCKSYGILYSKSSNDKNLYPKNSEIEGCINSNVNFIEPLYAFSNSIGISQGLTYENDYFYNFTKNIFVSSLKGKSLYRLLLNTNNDRVIQIEKINLKKRIRDILITKNGRFIFLSDKGFINIVER